MTRPISRVLFVTRKFPPSVGGMETLASDVWQVVEQRWPGSRLLAHGGPIWRSAFWGPAALFSTARQLRAGTVDAIVAGDAVMASALRAVLWVRRVPTIAFVMGRDLTWDKPGYRALVRWGLKRWDLIAAISTATGAVAAELTSDPAKVEVIRLGVALPSTVPDAATARTALVRRWGLAESDLILVTLGRVVKRKGAAWFAGQVLPLLPDARYVVAGVGPDVEAVSAAAAAAGVSDRLVLTGAVTEAEREDLMAGCDVFVQPNISVPGDMEGFGLVVVEAALRGAVVLAAELEGLRDAVEDGRTGVLLPSAAPGAWAERIAGLGGIEERRALGAGFSSAARELYGREQMGRRLAEMFRTASTKADHR